jgi:UDP-glucuronate 4-epimerase
MRVLVTGSAGFIGYHVTQAALAAGMDVVGVDNFNDYYTPRLKRDRSASLRTHPRYTELEMDISDWTAVQGLACTAGFDCVCHLAAQAGVRYSLVNPFIYLKTNGDGFLNILELCRQAKISRLVYASSSSVYGGNTKLPFSETDPVEHPVSLYAATKRANELMAHAYTNLYGLQTVGLRFFTVYGPWGRPDMALWQFTESMLAGHTIQLFNHGDMKRDFTFITDIVQGVMASITAPALDPFEIINLGNHHPEPLQDLVSVLAKALQRRPQIEYLPMQPGDVKATYADTRRAEEKLGFSPRVSIREGIPRFVEWYQEYHRSMGAG